MQERLRIGIIGSGRIARSHTPGLAQRIPGAQVVKLASRNLKTAHDLADPLGIPVCQDYHELLEDPGIDAVFIFSNTDTHAQICIEAAAKGKHIFCEKPIDREAHRIKEVIQAVEQAGVKFQVGFNRRFDRHFLSVRQQVAAGLIGEVQLIKVTSRDPQAPPPAFVRTSGGMYADMSIHDFDMVQYLSGAKVVEVAVYGANLIDPAIREAGDVDTAVILLRLDSGALAVIDNSRQAVYGYDQRVEVFGSKGCVMAENEITDNTVLATADGVFHQPPLWNFLERYNAAFLEEDRQFVAACLKDEPTPMDARAGLYPVLIADAAKRSSELGGLPVRVEQIKS
ncbi:MAG: inositol 2-dehydrogenase [Christensenellales bacterium]